MLSKSIARIAASSSFSCLAIRRFAKLPFSIAPNRTPISQQCRFLSQKLEEVNEPHSFTSDPDVFNSGDFDVLLPPEPYVFGCDHIQPRSVPAHICKPWYAKPTPLGALPAFDKPTPPRKLIPLGGCEEKKLRNAAKLARRVREYAATLVKAGRTTNEIDELVHDFVIENGAYPSPLGYFGFPRSCCTSINNILVHGIPDDRPLQGGDIINIDITVFLDGYHGDTSQTFLVGNVDDHGRELVHITNHALEKAIEACGPGRHFKGIASAIHKLLRDKPYSVSTGFTGHGIGDDFHRPPWILHHKNDEPGFMTPGDCFTIEPCVVQGSNPRAWIWPDGWTASSENCARSAQTEHMILITNTGAEVLTR